MSLDTLANTAFVLIGAAVYVSLWRQIPRRSSVDPILVSRGFGIPDAFVAAFLSGWFGLNLLGAASAAPRDISTRDLLSTAAFSIALLAFLAAFLRGRGLHVIAMGGFSKIGFGKVFCTAAVLLLAAYPLILVADVVTTRLLGSDLARQEMINTFNGSQSLRQRALIILLAVALAPLAEEFIFRFFLFGVLKRYVGRLAGLVLTSLLFAAVHQHLPSFFPLFVLGSCFTIAYEWSGSILVPMTMHALFNFMSLTALAFPDIFPQ